MKTPPYSREEIDRQYRMAPALLLRAVRSGKPSAVEFCYKSIERIVEAKSVYEEMESK